MIPACRLTTYKDVPYTFLFMNRICRPKEQDRDPDSGDPAAGSSHGGGERHFRKAEACRRNHVPLDRHHYERKGDDPHVETYLPMLDPAYSRILAMLASHTGRHDGKGCRRADPSHHGCP